MSWYYLKRNQEVQFNYFMVSGKPLMQLIKHVQSKYERLGNSSD